MRRYLVLLGIPAIMLLVGLGHAQTQHEVVEGKPTEEAHGEIAANVDVASATIFNPHSAALLLKSTVCHEAKGCQIEAKDFYAVIHILRWSDPSGSSKDQTAISQNWYVYHSGLWTQDKFTDAKRLYGAKYVYFLFVHLNVRPSSHPYTARYEFEITKKTPSNIEAIFLLAQLAASPGALTTEEPKNVWGGRRVEIGLQPSDITISPRYVTDASSANRGNELANAQTFDNEGKHYWDVSLAIPIKKISELQFDSTNSTVTPSKIATTNAFGVLNLYLPSVDLKGTSYSYIPHPIAGVALSHQPLHKILIGGAVGLHYAQLYAGALLVKQQHLAGLQTGSPATSSQVASASHYEYDTQFTVGINLPVRTAIDALKKSSKK